ncbi:hypothetical protein ACFLU6_12735, partial [Acidobacteriota bacterium]
MKNESMTVEPVTEKSAGISYPIPFGPSGSGLIIVILLALTAFCPAIASFFIGDDFDFLLHTSRIDSVKEALTFSFWGEYMPVFTLTFLLDRALWDLNPLGFHLTSFIFHALATLAAFLLGRELAGQDARIGFICAVLFAVHPVHDEAVIYIAARAHVAAAASIMLALYFHARFRRTGRIRNLLAGVGLLALALLSKEAGLLVPGLVLALDGLVLVGPERNLSAGKRIGMIVPAVIPYLAVSMLYLLGRFFFIQVAKDKVGLMHENTWEWERIPAYFTMTFLPLPGTLLDAEGIRLFLIPGTVLLCAVFICVVMLYIKDVKRGVTSMGAPLLFSLLFFLATTAPFLMDALKLKRRYAYYSSFGACLFFSIVIVWLFQGKAVWKRILSAALLGLLVIGCGVASIDRSLKYRTSGKIAKNIVEDLQAGLK